MRLTHNLLIKKLIHAKDQLEAQYSKPDELFGYEKYCITIFHNLSEKDVDDILKYIYTRKKKYLSKLRNTLSRFDKQYKESNNDDNPIDVDKMYQKREKEISKVVENIHTELIRLVVRLTTRHNIKMKVYNKTTHYYLTAEELRELFSMYDNTCMLILMLEDFR